MSNTDTVKEDVAIARRYQSKIDLSKERGIEFKLSLISFRNLAKAKRCYYTGLPLGPRTHTIDRIDCKKGYVKGNVVACHKSVNSAKNTLEQLNLSPQQIGKCFGRIK